MEKVENIIEYTPAVLLEMIKELQGRVYELEFKIKRLEYHNKYFGE